MKRYLFLTVLSALAGLGAIAAAPVEDAFDAYAKGDYSSAARGFETALATNGPSAGLYYDLAMALKKSDDPAGAALNLRRAITLAPQFADARMALSEIERSAGIPLAAGSWRSWLAEYAPLNALLFLGFCVFWVGAFTLLFQFFRPKASVLAISAGFLLCAAGASSFTAAYFSDLRFAWRDMAVVVNSGGTKLSADPSERAEAVARLAPASPLVARQASGTWTYCTLADGRGGWVPAADIAKVIPEKSK